MYARHDSNCQLRFGGECTCEQVTYRASAKGPDQHSRLLSPELGSAIEARDWLRDQRARLTAAIAVAAEGPSVATVIQEFLAAAERGEARDRSGAEYTRTRLSQIRGGLAYVEAEIGELPLQAVRRRHVQGLVDELHGAGLSSERIIETVSSFRDLFIYAIQRDLVDFNPIVQLRLPADDVRGADEPVVTTAAYTVGATMSMNGDGNHAAAPQPATVATAEQPFDGEPTYGPGMEVPADEPESAPPTPPPTPEEHQFAPVLGPPMGTPFVPPSAPTAGYPYDPPMFATPAQTPMAAPLPPGTRMLTPIGAETHYGTPTYGAESIPTQATIQAPRQDAQDGVVMSEQMFWWITRIVVIVFVLIALVLVAESV
ncbi:MAG TPA: hypothetical protein VF066_18530 [Thermoleophilaceae bacterium]